MKKNSNSPKVPQKRARSPGRELRDQRILVLALSGMTSTDIAQEMGCDRKTVWAALNRDAAKELIHGSEQDVRMLLMASVEALRRAITSEDLASSVRAAIAVLKSQGVLRESTDIHHNFPKPCVIKRTDGAEIVLGTSADIKIGV